MASINFGSFFGSSSSSSSGLSGLLSDYSAIKNGSYKKLLKANYDAQKASSTSGSSAKTNHVLDKILDEKKNPKVSAEAAAANSALSSDVSTLKSAIGSLQKDSTFTDTEGGSTAKEKVAAALKSFAESYNNTVKDAKESTLSGVTSNVASMMKTTSANADALKEIGLNLQDDGTFVVDEKALANVDINKVHELFDSDEVMSYGSTIGSRMRFASYGIESSAAAASATTTQTKQSTDESASGLKADAEALASDSLYAKLKDENGNDTEFYDIDAITSKAKSFVNNFNNMLNAAKFSTNSGVSSNLSYMVSRNQDNSDALANFGITVGKDGSLSINEDMFKKSDMDAVKKFFDNYGAGTATNASLVNFYMNSQANAASGYNANGSYQVSDSSNYYTGSV